MRIESIYVRNFLSHAETKVSFEGRPLWLIVGPNGAGKSALFDAVEFALYGSHRGGKQKAEYLIRSDCEEAEVEVVFHHGGQRYRVTRKLRRDRGNAGGRLFSEQNGEWRSVEGASATKRAVWEYVKREIVPQELFASAVYLKQGAVDFFLGGTATDRGGRFASLMSLEEYDRLADAAQVRAIEEQHTAEVRDSDFERLGDVSEEAVENVQHQVASLDQDILKTETQVEELRQKEKDASLWTERTMEIEKLDRDEETLRILLDQAEEIRAASRLVQSWSAVVADLQRYWNSRDRAAEHRQAAGQAEVDATEQEQIAAAEEQERLEAQKRLDKVKERLLAARQALATTKMDAELARRELDIATRVSSLNEVRTRLEQLTGAEETFTKWEEQRRALPRMWAVVHRREGLDNLRANRPKRDQLASLHRVEEAELQERFDLAERRILDILTALSHAREEAKERRGSISALDKAILEHSQLSGEEGRCPVCDQELDVEAHAHVLEVIQVKQAALVSEQAVLARLETEIAQLQRELEKAQTAQEASDKLLEEAHQQRQSSEEAMRILEAQIADAEAAYAQAVADIEAEAQPYSAMVRELKRARLEVLEAELETQRQSVEANRNSFQRNQADYSVLLAQLGVLRSQRGSGVSAGPGDSGDITVVERQTADLECREQSLLDEVAQLELEEQASSSLVQSHAVGASAAKAHATLRRRQASEYRELADTADQAAQAVSVPLQWRDCLSEKGTYESRSQEVENARPTAARLRDLDAAEGAMNAIRALRARMDVERQSIPARHRVDPRRFQSEIAVLQSRREELGQQRGQLQTEMTLLEDRQRQARRLCQQAEVCRQRAKTFSQLGRLLGPGGDIQLQVAARVQEEVRSQANTILHQINDGLEIRLGEPRREGTSCLDVLVFDRRDPSSRERYFEFLSGGEKFRVGLAVALAIHWRATGKSPGTVIVDEGFGVLDDERRLAIAEQMADVSTGLLRDHLVEQIIICTHATDVQSYFPYRWEIAKVDGIAVVTCVEPNA